MKRLYSQGWGSFKFVDDGACAARVFATIAYARADCFRKTDYMLGHIRLDYEYFHCPFRQFSDNFLETGTCYIFGKKFSHDYALCQQIFNLKPYARANLK